MCLKVPFRLASQTFQLGRRMSSSQKGCGTSVTSSKPVAIGSMSGLESTEAASSIDGGWATRLTRGRVRCGEVWPLVGEKLLLGMKAAACVSNRSMVRAARDARRCKEGRKHGRNFGHAHTERVAGKTG